MGLTLAQGPGNKIKFHFDAYRPFPKPALGYYGPSSGAVPCAYVYVLVLLSHFVTALVS